jgi:hypothetical protein
LSQHTNHGCYRPNVPAAIGHVSKGGKGH